MLAACGAAGGAPTPTGESSPTSTSTGAASYPVTIQNCGRTLTFDKAPSRAVLSFHPIAEIFVGLGLAGRAIGRVAWEGGTKEPPILPEQAADFKRIPVVSGTIYPPPKERMLSLRADFLLAYADFDYGGTGGAEGLATLDELEAAGVKVYSVECPGEHENIEQAYRAILDLGKIFGVTDRASRRVAAMKAQIAAVSQKVHSEPVVKVIGYAGGQGPLHVAGGRASLVTRSIEAAGGENVFADLDKDYPDVSLETVAASQADVFLVWPDLSESTDTRTDTFDGTKGAQFLFSAFPNMAASKDRRFAVTDYIFTSPGWRSAQTVEDIARQLHPNAFK